MTERCENSACTAKVSASMSTWNWDSDAEEEPVEVKPIIIPDRTPRTQYRNKQRTLVLCSRGIGSRERHLMNDLIDLIPHSRKDTKVDCKKDLTIVAEMATMRNCNNILYFELKNRKDMFMWMAKTTRGPTVKFHVDNVHTMAELKLTGNCLKGSRPLLSFDSGFTDEAPAHVLLVKEMLTQIFGSPKGHPKTKPFHDHVYSFSLLDDKIWFRHFQVIYDADPNVSLKEAKKSDPVLVEIGPRFVLTPVTVLAGSFSGAPLFENEKYTYAARAQARDEESSQYLQKEKKKATRNARLFDTEQLLRETDLQSVFLNDDSDSE